MKQFQKIKTTAVPFDKVNVDTDQIVPKQFLKLIQKTGFGKFLFYNWRFDGNEIPNQSFILNDPKYKNSKIFITGENFGCGSSREHAVWALQDYGFSVIIAPSFGDIFYSNCFKNGLLAITLDPKIVQKLLQIDTELEVDLENQIIKTNTEEIPFQIDRYNKKNLLEGFDEIALTIKNEDKISEYEQKSNVSSLL
jgi:3-isopropylmalate/(R)-2-methylmalate dehydratase small subunit